MLLAYASNNILVIFACNLLTYRHPVNKTVLKYFIGRCPNVNTGPKVIIGDVLLLFISLVFHQIFYSRFSEDNPLKYFSIQPPIKQVQIFNYGR